MAIKDFAKNLKDESDITVSVSSQQTQNAPKQEPQHELLDENSGNSNASSMPDQKSGNINAGSFLGMAAASLMDPSAAKGTFFKENVIKIYPNMESSTVQNLTRIRP